MGILQAVCEYARDRGINIYSVTVADGSGSRTEHIREDSRCRNIYSVAKAFTMCAAGMLYDEGRLGIRNTMADIFGTLPCGSDERWRDVTVHDIMRHKTGILSNCLDFDCNDIRKLIPDGDVLGYILRTPLDGQTGITYAYSDAAYYLLSRIVSRLTGVTLCEYLREKLFIPLECGEYAWSVCPHGYSTGGSGLYISCEDMTKLGTLWLGGGLYNGKRVISGEWTELALKNNYAFSPRECTEGGYYKTGMLGQLLYFSYKDGYSLGIQSYEPSGRLSELVDALLVT